MRIEKLENGMNFKNYRALCEFLEMEVLGGNQKKLQMKELKRFCDFVKIGQAIIITEIYDTPKPKVENRGKGTGEKKNSVDYILSRIIIKNTIENQDRCLEKTTMSLLGEFGLIKNEFKKMKETAFERLTSTSDMKYLFEVDPFVENFVNEEYKSLQAHVREAMAKVDKMKHFNVYKFPVLTYREWNEDTQKWTIKKRMTLKETVEIQELYAKKSEIIESLDGNGEMSEFQWIFGVYQNLGKYYEFNRQWREYLFNKYKMNSMHTVWSVVTVNPSESNIAKLKEKFAEDFDNINKIYNMIYKQRLGSAEREQAKYCKIEGEGEFVDKSREIWKATHDLFICDKVTQSKIEGEYVEIWKELFKELMF